MVTLQEPPALKVCAAAALIGAAGLIVAYLGGVIGPAALLVQGQAWRWIWPAYVMSVVLMPAAPAAYRARSLLRRTLRGAAGRRMAVAVRRRCRVRSAGIASVVDGATGSARGRLRVCVGQLPLTFAALLAWCTVDSWPALTSRTFEKVRDSVEVTLLAASLAWFLPGLLRSSRRLWQARGSGSAAVDRLAISSPRWPQTGPCGGLRSTVARIRGLDRPHTRGRQPCWSRPRTMWAPLSGSP